MGEREQREAESESGKSAFSTCRSTHPLRGHVAVKTEACQEALNGDGGILRDQLAESLLLLQLVL